MEKLMGLPGRRNIETPVALISLLLMGAFLLLGHLIGFTAYHGGFGVHLADWMNIVCLIMAFVFLVPLLTHWRQRQQIAWLALPVATLFTLTLIFSGCGFGGQWESWHFRWPVLPLGIGGGIYGTYLIGKQERWLLLVATAVTGYAIWVFAFFSAFKAGLLYTRPLLPFSLFLCGIALVILNLVKARQY